MICLLVIYKVDRMKKGKKRKFRLLLTFMFKCALLIFDIFPHVCLSKKILLLWNKSEKKFFTYISNSSFTSTERNKVLTWGKVSDTSKSCKSIWNGTFVSPPFNYNNCKSLLKIYFILLNKSPPSLINQYFIALPLMLKETQIEIKHKVYRIWFNLKFISTTLIRFHRLIKSLKRKRFSFNW